VILPDEEGGECLDIYKEREMEKLPGKNGISKMLFNLIGGESYEQ